MNKIVLLFLFSLNCFGALNTYNDKSQREKRAEFSIGLNRSHDFDLSGKSGGSLNAESDYGFEFDAGYNYSQKIYFGGTFSLNSPNYTADVTLDDGSTDRYTSSLSFASFEFLTRYTFLKTSLSPYIEGGFGYSNIDSGVPSGELIQNCWLDPFYGYYVCGYQQPNKSKGVFSYSGGVGLKYELTRSSFVKLGAKLRYFVYDGTTDFPSLFTTNFSIGFLIK